MRILEKMTIKASLTLRWSRLFFFPCVLGCPPLASVWKGEGKRKLVKKVDSGAVLILSEVF